MVGAPIVRDGLICEYRFDARQGQIVRDCSGYGYHATFGQPLADPLWAAEGMSFDSDDFISAMGSDTPFLGALTVCVVANIRAGTVRTMAAKAAAEGTTNPFDFRTDSNASNPPLIVFRANAASKGYRGPATVTNAWRMYSVTFPATIQSNPTFYVGTSSSAPVANFGTATGAATGTNYPLRVGATVGSVTDMLIGYALFYNRELTSGEITTNYNALKTYLAPRGIALP